MWRIVLLLLLAWPLRVRADDRVLAVLRLDASQAGDRFTSDDERETREDIRKRAVQALVPAGWIVVGDGPSSRGLGEPPPCADLACHQAAARRLKADKFISGTVWWAEGVLAASIRMLDTATGRVLASESASGDSPETLRADFAGRADRFFEKTGLLISQPPAKEADEDEKPTGGGLSSDEVQQVVTKHMKELQYCYERELANNPRLRGKVTLSWVIGPSGDVASVSAHDSTLNGAVDSCLAASVRRWKFPEPHGGGGVSINYPFVFTAP